MKIQLISQLQFNSSVSVTLYMYIRNLRVGAGSKSTTLRKPSTVQLSAQAIQVAKHHIELTAAL